MTLMNITFLLTHIPNPRINKRIELIKSEHTVSVVCARRKSQNFYSSDIDGVKYYIMDMDMPSSKQLLKRYLVSWAFFASAWKQLERLHPDIIYAEGLDCLIIAGKYKKKYGAHIIYEAADLREAFISKPRDPVKRVMTEALLIKERREFKNVGLLVITSPKFYDAHFNTLISADKAVFIPNAPDRDVFREYKRKTSGEFTVGFIGSIRYIQQMKMLVDAAGMAGCRVLFAGSGIDEQEIREYCRNKGYVSFTGKYDYNTQIAGLYGSVDCVFAVYDADNPNVRIALPNKLYESILCGLPIISAKGTYFGELTEQWGVGLTVGHTDTEALCDVLKKLRDDRKLYESIRENCCVRKSDIDPEKGNARLMKAIEEMSRS